MLPSKTTAFILLLREEEKKTRGNETKSLLKINTIAIFIVLMWLLLLLLSVLYVTFVQLIVFCFVVWLWFIFVHIISLRLVLFSNKDTLSDFHYNYSNESSDSNNYL